MTVFYTGGGEIPMLRNVRPYVHRFRTHAKGRWLGRTLLEIHASEFGAQPHRYYEAAIDNGCITVNGAEVGTDYILRNGDVIEHATHRHEPPVRWPGSEEALVVADTPDLLVVNKPSSIPIHPCGAYYHNSIFQILRAAQLKLKNQTDVDGDSTDGTSALSTLHTVHRLDRLTSGITLLAKSVPAAKAFGEDLRAGYTAKTYLARVQGDFSVAFRRRYGHFYISDGETGVEGDSRLEMWERAYVILEANPQAIGWSFVDKGAIRVQQPIACRNHKGGVMECPFSSPETRSSLGFDLSHCQTIREAQEAVEAAGRQWTTSTNDETASSEDRLILADAKEAATIIRMVSYNGRTSLVEVTPLHGRTHQIRLHLNYLGYPIANDAAYGGELHYGDTSRGIPEEDPHLYDKLQADGCAGREHKAPCVSLPNAFRCHGYHRAEEETGLRNHAASENEDDRWYSTPRRAGESTEDFVERVCRFCCAGSRPLFRAGSGEPPGNLQSKPEKRENYSACIWLHALRYERRDPGSPEKDWSFETPLPDWASEDFPF